MKKIISILLIISAIPVKSQVKNVLFIGNSYTYVNDLPGMIKGISLSFGDTMISSQSTSGGSSLNVHTTHPTTLSLLGQGGWDNVIIQAQSQEPSFSPGQVASQTYPYAKILVDSARAQSICVEPVFYMTWGRKNGDASNCGVNPPVCTYAGMQQRLKESYLEMADSNKAAAAPVGMAWNNARNNFPLIELYALDGSHPSLHGSYLTACVFYATLYQKTPIGSTYIPSGINAIDALNLQTVASYTVLDSLPLWRINANMPIANFNYYGGSTISFVNTSTNGVTYYWDFGDGNTSTQEHPNNTYLNNNTYTVKLITFSADSCFSDTITQNITVNNVGVKDFKDDHTFIVYPNPGNDFIQLKTELNYNNIVITDITGKIVKQIASSDKIDISELTNGVYFIQVYNNPSILKTIKFIKK